MTMPDILIGIPTRDRPRQLRELLGSLAEQDGIFQARVLVVDNSPSASARSVVNGYRGRLTVAYETEPRPGVVHVRNSILNHATSSDAVIFLDDDQVVGSQWFVEMLKMHRRFPRDVLAGPVIYRLPPATPEWVVRGGHYIAREAADASLIDITGTGNSLLPSSLLRTLGNPRFDPEFGLVGGEDTEYFARILSAGGAIRWCAYATVFEDVPGDRVTYKSLSSRYLSVGYSNALIRLRTIPRWRIRNGAFARLAWGSAKLAVARAKRRGPRRADMATYYSGRGYLRALREPPPARYGN